MRKDGRLADRMLEILIAASPPAATSTVLPEMAETVGVSKSQVSRETIEAGERLLKELAERDFSEARHPGRLDRRPAARLVPRDLRRGRRRRGPQARAGPPRRGHRERRGRQGAAGRPGRARPRSDAATAVRDRRLEGAAEGDRRRSSATRRPCNAAATTSFATCVGHLPKDQHDQAKATLKAAFKLDAKEGTAKLEQYATWLEREWPSAAASLREGLGGDCSRSTGWACPASCDAAWGRRT